MMSQWYVKDLSKLTQVSVQTLHHYDRIGLLEPSVRLPNGYRLYSEKDLFRLQQIIALKFFGFELSRVKTLLSSDIEAVDHLSAQLQFLEEKAQMLLEASQTLTRIISDCGRDKSIPWETMIKLIEVYRMMQEIEKTWAGKVLSPEELKQYVQFQQEMKHRYTEQDKQRFGEEWASLVILTNASLDKDPASDFGISMGKRCMEWVNRLYGKQYISLRNAIWEKGFKRGRVDIEPILSVEAAKWLDQAFEAYYKNCVEGLIAQVGKHPDALVVKQWEEFLADMYGNDQAQKDALLDTLMKDDEITQAVKSWLKQRVK